MTHTAVRKPTLCTQDALYDTREYAQCSPTQEESCSPIISPIVTSHEATPACREPPMRRYLRCPGAICCPAHRALRAVLQPHIRFCDELIADALSPLPRGCGASAHQLAAADAPWAASLADAFRIASPLTVALACATTLVLVRRREGSRCQPTGRHRTRTARCRQRLRRLPWPARRPGDGESLNC
jgi:hypothetical protein